MVTNVVDVERAQKAIEDVRSDHEEDMIEIIRGAIKAEDMMGRRRAMVEDNPLMSASQQGDISI